MKTKIKTSNALFGLISGLLIMAAGIFTTHSASAQVNVANGVQTGGTARPVQSAVYGGGSVYDPTIGICSNSWRLAGTLCDEAPTTHSSARSSKTNTNSGAAFTTRGTGTGVLVVDLGSVQTFSNAAVFQMFSDGKTTHFRLSSHPNTGATPPDWTNGSWTPLNRFDLIGAGNFLGGSPTQVSDPTLITLPTTSSRYVRVEVRNDGRYGNITWTELRSFKLFGPLNAPPTVSAPASATIHCTSLNDAMRTVTFNVADSNNDPLTVTWRVDGVVVATHSLPAGTTSDSLVDYPFPVIAPLTHTVSVSVTDNKSAPVTATAKVIVAAHGAPAPSLASLPDITGECSASVAAAPTAIDDCAFGNPAGIITGTTTDPLTYTSQGNYTITWTYTDPHDASVITTQTQAVVVKDITPPTITCPPNVAVAYGSVPAAATTVDGFLAQGGTIQDNCDPYGTVNSYDAVRGFCPTVITRTYRVRDAVGNEGLPCEQIITVNNLFAEDGVIWHQPLARNGASEDTDPGAANTLKYRFKLGSTIPIKIHAQGCTGDVTPNSNVTGKVVVFGDTDMDGVIDANEGALVIDFNGVGESGGVMDKIDGHLKYNLDTKKLPQTFKCYILQVTVTDTGTGESRVETVPLQSK